MIIVGFQGIGKTTLANINNGFIDLESSNFFVEGIRPKNWYIMYCQIANNLSKQGYHVFVSSHKEVRDELKRTKSDVFICCPSLDLKELWIQKLKERYDVDSSEKNYKAYMIAVTQYDELIKDLMSEDWVNTILIITSMNYNLKSLLSFSLNERKNQHG